VVELAHRHPDLTRGVIAVDGGFLELQAHFPNWDDCASALAPPNLLGTPATRMREYMRSAHADWPESGIEGQMGNFEVLNDGTIRPWLSFDRHLQVLRGLWEHRPSELFPAISIPVMFVPADHDHGVFAATKRHSVQRAIEALSRGRVEWFHGADHDLHAQHPERFADVVSAAIAEGFFS
jgi:pimeloyl-ACP methyl ester carboxylesterase